MLLSTRSIHGVKDYDMVDSRLLWVLMKLDNTRVFIVALYASVSSLTVGDLKHFWYSVRDILDMVDANDRVVIKLLDFDAIQLPYRVSTVDDAFKYIIDLCLEKNILIANNILA